MDTDDAAVVIASDVVDLMVAHCLRAFPLEGCGLLIGDASDPIVNGDVRSAEDAKRALELTGCEGVMVGRRAIEHPWIFREARALLDDGVTLAPPTAEERIALCREHLIANVERCPLPAILLEVERIAEFHGPVRGSAGRVDDIDVEKCAGVHPVDFRDSPF